MKLEELALCTRKEFKKELNRMCPYPTDDMNPGEYDAAFEERVRTRSHPLCVLLIFHISFMVRLSRSFPSKPNTKPGHRWNNLLGCSKFAS